MEKLAENDLTYFYLRHVVIVVYAVTTISLTPVIIGDIISSLNHNIIAYIIYGHDDRIRFNMMLISSEKYVLGNDHLT